VLGEEYAPQPTTRMAEAPKGKKRNPKLDTIDNPFAMRDEDLVPRDRFQYAQAAAPAGIAALDDVNQLAMLSSPYVQQQGGDTSEYEMPEDTQGGYAGGGVIALAHGGIPRFQQGGYFQDPFGNVDSAPEPDWYKTEVEEGKPYEPSFLGGVFGYKVVPPKKKQEKKDASSSTADKGKGPAPQGTQKDWRADADEGKKTRDTLAAEKDDGGESLAAATGYRPDPGGYGRKLEQYTPKAPDYSATQVPELTDITEERRQSEVGAGIDPNFYSNMISKIEEKKGSSASAKDRAAGEAIMLAGFKLMGARRGQGFEALSEGAQLGLRSYQNAMDKLSDRQEKYDARIEALQIADQQARKTGLDSDIARRDALEKAARDDKRAIYQVQADMTKVGANAATSLTVADINYLGHMASVQAQRHYTNALREQGMRDQQIKLVLDTAEKIYKNQLTVNPQASFDDAFNEAVKQYGKVGGMFGRGIQVPAPAAPTPDAYEKQYGMKPAFPQPPK